MDKAYEDAGRALFEAPRVTNEARGGREKTCCHRHDRTRLAGASRSGGWLGHRVVHVIMQFRLDKSQDGELRYSLCDSGGGWDRNGKQLSERSWLVVFQARGGASKENGNKRRSLSADSHVQEQATWLVFCSGHWACTSGWQENNNGQGG